MLLQYLTEMKPYIKDEQYKYWIRFAIIFDIKTGMYFHSYFSWKYNMAGIMMTMSILNSWTLKISHMRSGPSWVQEYPQKVEN